ncbi:MAG TPA: efflux RND transporter permease subunit [Xanthomonadaceae bacterium]|nr:efflux RND transporter permease subunit [Xanthomonadaceae bacterium]
MAAVGQALRSGGLAAAAIRRPVGTLALVAVVFVLGVFFAGRLPIDLLPTVEYPHIRVTVNYPGTAPEIMEEQVTRVLERNLAATENLTRITGRASEGRTNVDLHFAFGTDIDVAMQDASRYLELARTQLPADIEPPRLYKFDPAQDPIWQAGFSSTLRSEVAVRDWALNSLSPILLAIEGVAAVEAAGGQEREIEVIADQERLRSYGLSLRDLVDALRRENIDIAGGWVTSDRFDVMAKTEGLFDSVEAIGNVLLSLPGDSDRRIRVSEVAKVRDGFREQRLFVRMDGLPAAQVAVFKLPAANTVQVVDQVNATMARLQRSGFVPDDIVFSTTRDPAYFIRGALTAVGSAALLGGCLAMLAVFLFLGSLRKSLIVGLSIPTAILATFSLMGASGITLNIISLGGLALGVGLLLDNAIVMLENIYRHREGMGKSDGAAAREGAAEVQSAITAGTLTNLAAVLPFLLISGLAALIFRDLILTISFAILATLAAALTLVPMLAALLGGIRWQSGLAQSVPLRLFNRGLAALRRRYRRLMSRLLRRRFVVIAFAAAAFIAALLGSDRLGNEFLPQVDDGAVSARLVLPRGTPPQETDAAARAIEAELRAMPHIENIFTLVGGHLGGGVVNERPGTASFRIQLAPAGTRPAMSAGIWVAEAQARLQALDLPGARISVRPPSIRGLQFSVSGNDLSVGIVGEDLRELQRLARAVASRLQNIPGLEGIEVGREEQSPLMRVRVDREGAADLGLSIAEVGEALRMAVNGTVATRYMAGSQEYDVRVRLSRETVSNADALGNLLLIRTDGMPVLLGDVARFELGEGPAHIERENQSRIVRVNGDINTAITDVGSVMAVMESRLAGIELPDRYSMIIGGQWETIEDMRRELGTVVLLAVFLVFVVLAVQYERLMNPLVILAAAPLALVGVVVALGLAAVPVSAPVLIGVILLIGIVVNNAILLVEQIGTGYSAALLSRLARAVVAAAGIRLRPILMTTATTVLGMLPLALGLGEGAEIMRPLALAVIGGLSLSMLLTLLVVPCLYLIGDRVAAAFKGRLRVAD